MSYRCLEYNLQVASFASTQASFFPTRKLRLDVLCTLVGIRWY
jgi:hypothetical protein